MNHRTISRCTTNNIGCYNFYMKIITLELDLQVKSEEQLEALLLKLNNLDEVANINVISEEGEYEE